MQPVPTPPPRRATPGRPRRAVSRVAQRQLALPLSVLAMAGIGSACSQEPSCTSRPVQEALRKALDKTYADARTYYGAEFTVDDTITVRTDPGKAMCKAVLTINLKILSVVQQEQGVAKFTAERTEAGNIIVTVYE